MPFVSIIICTCNRAAALRQTLEAIGALPVPAEMPAELIIVDNGSTDDTADVVKSCGLSNLPVRYIHELRRGKGYAYNRGMAEAQGQVLLFTDDDVRPCKNWIAGMCEMIAAGTADAVAGGVTLAPHLLQPWMTRKHRGMLASTEDVDPNNPDYMVGANMAFSRRILEKVPEFDTRLGPGALGFYDEVLFSWQLKEAGFRLRTALDVLVEHHPDPSRINRAAFLETHSKYGRSLGYLEHHWHHNTIKAVRLRLLLRRARLLFSSLSRRGELRRLPSPPEWEYGHFLTIALLDQYLRERRKPRRYSRHGLRKLF